MSTLTNIITAARDLAADLEDDIRIKEFLRAITISADEKATQPIHAAIDCHSRSWYRYFFASEIEALSKLSTEDLADVMAGWVKNALERNILTLSNPPVSAALAGAHDPDQVLAARTVVTYIYDRNGGLVGRRSG